MPSFRGKIYEFSKNKNVLTTILFKDLLKLLHKESTSWSYRSPKLYLNVCVIQNIFLAGLSN